MHFCALACTDARGCAGSDNSLGTMSAAVWNLPNCRLARGETSSLYSLPDFLGCIQETSLRCDIYEGLLRAIKFSGVNKPNAVITICYFFSRALLRLHCNIILVFFENNNNNANSCFLFSVSALFYYFRFVISFLSNSSSSPIARSIEKITKVSSRLEEYKQFNYIHCIVSPPINYAKINNMKATFCATTIQRK